MLRILASSAVIALLSGAAFAADIPSYEPAADFAPVPSEWNWSGVYLGAHGGYGWGEAETDFGTIDDVDGFVAGGQIGYNWQWDAFVFGVEGDGSWSGMDGDNFGVEADIDYLATIRGRVGLGFDRFLVYGTGGVAFAGVDVNDPVLGDDDNTHIGWVAGAGGEVMLTQNLSLGAEYLHYELGEEEYFDAIDADGSADVVRGRVNIKFNSLFGG